MPLEAKLFEVQAMRKTVVEGQRLDCGHVQLASVVSSSQKS